MANHGHYALPLFFIISILVHTLSFLCIMANMDEASQVYIVYMGALPEKEYSASSHHLILLQNALEEKPAERYLIRSYKRSFNGFAAKLTDREKEKISEMKGVVSVFSSKSYQLHTTRSWDFVGLPVENNHRTLARSDVIIGVIDSGIWPESESFNDDGFGPPPKWWKGACLKEENFTCNNKVIGGRYYNSARGEQLSARDDMGHGTHVASTAAGNVVKNVSFYGLAAGDARGAVPSARIAAYKVCHPNKGCDPADILAAFDDAIADGVDIITISMGSSSNPTGFEQDTISIGAFHAMEKGILTLNSAGNNGPERFSSSSVSPWLLSVAASSMDRRIIDKVVLGNGKTLKGSSVNSFTLNRKVPLLYGKEISHYCDELDARSCYEECLDRDKVKGKIVLCDEFEGNYAARRAGALGSIVNNTRQLDVSLVVPSPVSALSIDDFDAVVSYKNSTKKAEAYIARSEAIEDSSAPLAASFSSRGPNYLVPNILKPDISAPGIDILAAYSPIKPPSEEFSDDERRVKFNIMTGTSMACPHAAGAAAYVKTIHPDWSPSAIKSALMTTAQSMSSRKDPDGEFAYGSGLINPIQAAHPGLVYEIVKQDYIRMLCSMGYNVMKLRRISGNENTTCPEALDKISAKDMNYPSMVAQVPPKKPFTVTFNRTVKNVGPAPSSYTARIDLSNPPKIRISVVPEVLSFDSLHENKSFVVTVTGDGLPSDSAVSASLLWTDGFHGARSPIVLYTFVPNSPSE